MIQKNKYSPNTEPLLVPPHRGWVRDLAEPDSCAPTLISIEEVPVINSMNGVYLEVNRKPRKMRGLLLALSIFGIAWLIFAIPLLISPGMKILNLLEISAVVAAMLWWTIFMIRVDTAPPRDEPIRFNRLRRKAFVYSFRFLWWNPFARWYVTTKSYNWADLRAEVWRQRGATAQGGLIITWGVSIAVIKPGTNEVIDRFPLSVGQDEGSSWDYVCAYMQHGPEALPPVERFNDPNEVPSYNLALRLAPRVHWPEQMDAESRSGPEDSPAVVQAQHKGQTDK